jgi:dienelactone hydrolase
LSARADAVKPRSSGRYALAIAAALFLSGCANFWLLYPGTAETNDPQLDPEQSGLSHEDLTVTNPQGNRLHGWLFADPGDRGTVLVAGGNAQNISSIYDDSHYLIGNGFRVLVFTYQGFDQNQGRADLNSLIGDAQAFYLYVQLRYPGEPIAIVGYSLGAVAGICLADRDPVRAIVGEGLFNPKTIVADQHLWLTAPFASKFAATVPDDLDANRCLQNLKSVPILILHSPGDPLSPYDSARGLYDSYSGPKEFIVTNPEPGTDSHYGSFTDPAAQTKVLDFLKAHLGS